MEYRGLDDFGLLQPFVVEPFQDWAIAYISAKLTSALKEKQHVGRNNPSNPSMQIVDHRNCSPKP